MWFYYDHSGKRIALEYHGEMYYYVYNVQGDVTYIVDDSGSPCGGYRYDSWGKIIDMYGSVAAANPFRYRGYYYDSETELYYLNSRYYNPEWGRFVNADSVTDGGAGLLGYNLFIYSANNPINNSDSTGKWYIKSTIKWAAKNIAKPVVKSLKKIIGRKDGAYTRGIDLSWTLVQFSEEYQIGISFDRQGNFAFQRTISSSISTATLGGSASIYSTNTNAKSIDDLCEIGAQLGGSAGFLVEEVPVVVGAELNVIPNKSGYYYGETTNVGLGTPGIEGHVGSGYTSYIGSDEPYNIYEILNNVYVKIMEW